jgi:RNA polymerase sigma factor (sigma-70 family)
VKREEVIKLADIGLKSVPGIKKRIRLIDIALKKDSYDMATIDKLKHEKDKLHAKLSRIIKAISTLEDDNQRIICYRYFDDIPYTEIALRVGLSKSTIPRRIKKTLLDIGRVMFGFEDEFWRNIFIND